MAIDLLPVPKPRVFQCFRIVFYSLDFCDLNAEASGNQGQGDLTGPQNQSNISEWRSFVQMLLWLTG